MVLALLLALVSTAGMLALERLFPARPLPRVRGWSARAIPLHLAGTLARVAGPAAAAAEPARLGALLGPTIFGVLSGALLAFVLADVLYYWTHRAMHRVGWLWRWTHQMHHSAERVEVVGAGWTHPFETAIQVALTSGVAAALGLSPAAAALAGSLGCVAGSFAHLNVRTPRWIGWIVQRPEAHSVHHARGVHAYNYGQLAVLDGALGTLRNPTTFADPAGFWDGASRQVGPMLGGRDIGERGIE